MFGAQILSIERGNVIDGADREYEDISDGMNKNLMREIARELMASLTGGEIPPAEPVPAAAEKPAKAPKEPKESAPMADRAAKLWTIGVSAGSSFATPAFIGTVHGTLAPLRHLFIELGMDFGLINTAKAEGNYTIDGYYSLYPFAHVGAFIPFAQKGGWYVGAGGGYMIAKYTFSDGVSDIQIFAADVTAGLNIGNFLDISYTLRTNFEGASSKVSVGYVYRF
jgi:hypothetical protein